MVGGCYGLVGGDQNRALSECWDLDLKAPYLLPGALVWAYPKPEDPDDKEL